MARGSEEEKAAEGGMKGKRTQGVSVEAQVVVGRRRCAVWNLAGGSERGASGRRGVHERTEAPCQEIKAKAITKRWKPDLRRALCKFNLLEIRQ